MKGPINTESRAQISVFIRSYRAIRSLLSATAIVALLTGGLVFTAKPVAASTVLYDQYNNVGTGRTSSLTAPGGPNHQAADDFVVPANTNWSIDEVDVEGIHECQDLGFNVFWYRSTGTLPGVLFGEQMFVRATSQPVATFQGRFVIPINPPMLLEAGSGWVSVQGVCNSGRGSWSWTNRAVLSNNPSAWRDQASGATSCTSWQVRSTCPPGDASEPDQVFSLLGTVSAVGPPPQVPEAPWALLLPSAGVIGIVMRPHVRKRPRIRGWSTLRP